MKCPGKLLKLLTSAALAALISVAPVCAEVVIDPSDADTALYNLSYSSLTGRLTESGYAATSLTGAYDGMYVRDAAIQIMAMTVNGDTQTAGLMLDYILSYHEATGYTYALCIIPDVSDLGAEDIAAPVSTKIQTDTTYMLLHAFAKWYNTVPQSADKKTFLERHWTLLCALADYYTTDKYFSDTRNLIFNPSFQHINRFYKCYDLITNVFASQAFYEMAKIALSNGYTDYSDSWENAAYNLKDGIDSNLIGESAKLKVYREMYDTQARQYYTGFSFLNFAPVAAEWFGIDEQIMDNTYKRYKEYASTEYNGVTLLDARHIVGTARWSEEALGKEIGWEIMYLAKKHDNSVRLRELLNFMVDNTASGSPYAESWSFDGKVSDVGNQEQTAWIIYALATVMPGMAHGWATTASSSAATVSSATPGTNVSANSRMAFGGSDRTIVIVFSIIIVLVAVSIATVLTTRFRTQQSPDKGGSSKNQPSGSERKDGESDADSNK